MTVAMRIALLSAACTMALGTGGAFASPGSGQTLLAQRAPLGGAAGANEQAAQDMFYRGFEALQRNRLEEAVGLFQQGLRYSPQNAMALYYLGHAYDRLGQFDQAAPLYQRAAALSPGTTEGMAARDRLRAAGISTASIPTF